MQTCTQSLFTCFGGGESWILGWIEVRGVSWKGLQAPLDPDRFLFETIQSGLYGP